MGKTNSPDSQPQTNTQGGLYIGGNVNVTDGSTFAGRDIIGYTAEQVNTLIAQITTQFQPKPFDGHCPYQGLEAFSEDDADRFFGRETLVCELVTRVKDSRFAVIAGPSGGGKSSLVRAGLIHALKQGALPASHSDRWLYATLTPGRDPIESLALAVSRLKSPDLGDYLRQHRQATPSQVIGDLAPVIRGWANYHRPIVAKQTFNYVDYRIWKLLWRIEPRSSPPTANR